MMKLHCVVALVLALIFIAPCLSTAEEPEASLTADNAEQPEVKEEPTAKESTQEIVVTATRIETPSKEIGSSVTVVPNTEIKQKQKRTVLEVLRSVPALDVVQTGGPGATTSIFIRGANSEHTLVLLDGIEMNDPISPGRYFDFANLTTDNIEQIEIIRGPQSTLYGSDAIGGVINIITAKGDGKPSGFVSVEGGSHSTVTERLGFSGGNESINCSLAFSHVDTDGISSANKKDGNDEKDGYENTTVSARLGVTPNEDFEVNFLLRWTDAEAEIDNSGGMGGDDPNNTYDSEQLFFRAEARLALFDSLWEQTLGMSLTDHERSYRNDVDVAHPDDWSKNTFDSRLLKFDWQHNLHLHETNTLTLGMETEREEGESYYYSESAMGPYESIFPEESTRTNGFYLQDQIKLWNSFFTTLGVRSDSHSEFGSEVTYRIASAYLFHETGTRIKGSIGTGFKAPSLYQLHSEYGDETLGAEKSKGWDLGIEQAFFDDRLVLGLTYFNNEFENLINYDSATSLYTNVAEAESDGLEFFASASPTDDLTIRFTYTYTETEDKATDDELLQRARNKAGFDVNYSFLEKGNVNLEATYVGERDDNDYSTYPATRVEMDAYALVNLTASYDITKNIQIFGRVNNLFDEDYEQVTGYGTPRVAGFAGVKLSF